MERNILAAHDFLGGDVELVDMMQENYSSVTAKRVKFNGSTLN